jgi:L-rhamnose mutarotase
VRRVCFTLQVDPKRIDEYRRRHAAVWPEMPTVDLRGGRPDRGMHVLNEVFNLEDQLGDL